MRTGQQGKSVASRSKDAIEKPVRTGRSRQRVKAELGLSPIIKNTAIIRYFSRGIVGELDMAESVRVLSGQVSAVQSGNLSGLEATLTAQVVALDAIFNEMARRAALNMGEHLGATETYLRLALKAQAQCRTAAQTLAEIKNPPQVAFVRQANIAHGPQQVNNGRSPGVTPPAPARGGISTIRPNELLVVDHEQRRSGGRGNRH